MSHTKRYIKVWDLLHNPWLIDTIDFSDREIDSMPEVCKPWVSGSITLQAINNTSIQVFLENISCSVEDISDVSGETFIREVFLQEYEVLFTLPEENIDVDDIYASFNDIYYINMKDFSIDLEDCVVNAIRSQEPIVKLKNDENLSDWWIDEYDMYEL